MSDSDCVHSISACRRPLVTRWNVELVWVGGRKFLKDNHIYRRLVYAKAIWQGPRRPLSRLISRVVLLGRSASAVIALISADTGVSPREVPQLC